MSFQTRAAQCGTGHGFAFVSRVLLLSGAVLSCLSMAPPAQGAPANIAPEYQRYTGSTGRGNSSQEHTTVEAVLADIESQFAVEADGGRCTVQHIRLGSTFQAMPGSNNSWVAVDFWEHIATPKPGQGTTPCSPPSSRDNAYIFGHGDNLCPKGTKWAPEGYKCASILEEIFTQKNDKSCPVGNPLYPLTGVKREFVDTRISIGGQPLVLTFDSSRRSPSNVDSREFGDPTAFGPLWLSSLHRRLVINHGTVGVQAYRGNGRIIPFSVNDGVISTSPDINDRLVAVTGGWRFTDAAARTEEEYDSAGVLKRLVRASGQALSFTYSDATTPTTVAPAPGYLISVSDDFGRTLRFEYKAAGSRWLVGKIIDAAGSPTYADYDTNGNLFKLTWADGKTRQFLYESANSPWALTGVIDERGRRQSTFRYDGWGRAYVTQRGGGVDEHSAGFLYGEEPTVQVSERYDSVRGIIVRTHQWKPLTGMFLRDPLNRQSNLTLTTVQNQSLITSRDQPAGSGCDASTSYQTHDGNGNVTSRDDFNRYRACYAYDAANRETTRVEGLANTALCTDVLPSGKVLPAGGRKVSTQWHPQWRLPAKVAEPLKVATYVYNGQPDPFNGRATAWCAPAGAVLPSGQPIAVLCKQVEQATTDADGSKGLTPTLQSGVANRVWEWTYNEYGQVRTARDPLGNPTSYTYPSTTAGDLQSVTDAKGNITRFISYNAHGDVLRSSDPNGVVTDITYDARRRVKTVTTAGAKTTYDWEALDSLSKITLPDGSFIAYTWDDAHRLKAISDNLGNRIEYELDNAGNRVEEYVKDPGTVLKRRISRAFDALDRVKQSTGRQ